MRGHTVKTPERVAFAMDLHREGWLLREIADHFGVSIKTIDSWLHDPDGARRAARHVASAQRCAGTCAVCGARTDGSRGRKNAATICDPCSRAERTVWTREAIVLAIQEWAAEYDGAPAAPDWNPWHAEHVLGDLGRAQRFRDADGRWPWFNHVVRVWGSWNAAIQAAGFEPRAAHGGAGNEQRRRAMRAKAER